MNNLQKRSTRELEQAVKASAANAFACIAEAKQAAAKRDRARSKDSIRQHSADVARSVRLAKQCSKHAVACRRELAGRSS